MFKETSRFSHFTAVLLASLFFVSSASAIIWAKVSWDVAHKPDPFLHDVARSCLTTASSHISSNGKTISVQDAKNCTDQIRALSFQWDHDPSTPMHSTNTRGHDVKKVRNALAEKFGAKKFSEIEVTDCPCMVFQGKNSNQAIHFVRSQLGAVQHGSTPLKLEGLPNGKKE